jgi:hypothetical protein
MFNVSLNLTDTTATLNCVVNGKSYPRSFECEAPGVALAKAIFHVQKPSLINMNEAAKTILEKPLLKEHFLSAISKSGSRLA